MPHNNLTTNFYQLHKLTQILAPASPYFFIRLFAKQIYPILKSVLPATAGQLYPLNPRTYSFSCPQMTQIDTNNKKSVLPVYGAA